MEGLTFSLLSVLVSALQPGSPRGSVLRQRVVVMKLRRAMAGSVEVTKISNDAWDRGEVGRGEVG